ncbi:cytochrome P450 [Auricularia subglabra TFB-10046 SS5]|nr:cytochrome P450 [Auricularia subglabra TFB-10046 SS5]
MPPTLVDIGVWACAAASLILLGSRFFKREGLPLPPGPPQLPLLGNALDMPAASDCAWVRFSEWAKKYGDVVYLNVLGQPILILSSAQSAADLLVKRGATYSDRPEFTMAKMSGWADGFAVMQYGERFRHARRLSGRSLNARAVAQYAPQHTEATSLLLAKLRQSPERFVEHIRLAIGSSILKIAYGFDVKDDDDPLVKIAEVSLSIFSASSAPGWAVDSFPALRYLPRWFLGAGFLRLADEWREQAEAIFTVPFNMVKERVVRPHTESALSTLLRDEDGNPVSKDDESLIMSVVGSLYGGGADTTVSAMLSFFLAMTLHPEVQKRAQAEIDVLTGGARLPTFDDRDSLPYIEAIAWEVQRWNPVGPAHSAHASLIGVPHRCSAEDEYRGYRIPAGTVVFANVWQILHDEKLYPDPLAFKPERYSFLDAGVSKSDAQTQVLNPDPRNIGYGYGRRECPGRYVADSSIWLMIASILASFDISKRKDDQGHEITPTVEYSGGIIRYA